VVRVGAIRGVSKPARSGEGIRSPGKQQGKCAIVAGHAQRDGGTYMPNPPQRPATRGHGALATLRIPGHVGACPPLPTLLLVNFYKH